ncbi:HlyD family efflux transporter periplasmic adaptor subunit [Myxococcus llanfairpwllgwyngyllgogerychwyrndrobwllllantysiliogogogochensis]|uniref:HlyD family efflux transporter periplasmic adaptor subunit n=1 Tax=Myxococcus llanfairpwllgwyngyllgogerychwyrndrobwllllantysiliogogogochensis TaxID=2590453 RepID=A0A540X884_9BACT|nr:HlyD family efflux transporter periplasmic adaptor subunit [Myxococcus llanfairpwllgwyngyllgogerychwyrndrobwllllantysiliogogogochensis]TQF17516.1 HlyD family efflux transporter periplasmic adaptor subunit [Myxococcus llanfairpwllgwyngyllgogerychwyrndrobwllllantysiliogogogochensis]
MSDAQPPPQKLFRQEALEHHARPEARGSLLRIVPGWTNAVWWLVVSLVVVGGVGLALVDVNDYARGPVLVRIKGMEEVTATAGGRVSRVLVHRGEHVRAGQPLVELYAGDETADRERVEEEFRSQLATWLLEPLNADTRQALAGLRAQLELSEARMGERVLKAPRDGQVGEVRVREQQFLAPGEIVVSLVREGAEAWAVALLPGQYRPMLRPGQPLRLELTGFPYAWQSLQVASISDELVGPAEVRRYLGPGMGDAVTVDDGPVVLVEARLPRETFESDGETYAYHPGMAGEAWVKVRARNGWLTLLPVLELLGKRRD